MMSGGKVKIVSACIVSILWLICSAVQAAVITYSTPTTVPLATDGSFLSIDGGLKIAANLTGAQTVSSNVTINGVTFSNSDSGDFSGGGITMDLTSGGALNSNFSDPGYADDGMGVLVRGGGTSGAASGGGAAITMSLSGLSIGQVYRLQTIHLHSGVNPALRATTVQNGSIAEPTNNQSSVISYSASNEAGYISMTWTADSSTQDFLFVSTPPDTEYARALLNGAVLHILPSPGHPAPDYGTSVAVPDDSGSVVLNSGEYITGIKVGNAGDSISTLNDVTFYAGGKSGGNVNSNNVQTQVRNGVTVTITPDAHDAQQESNLAVGLYGNTWPDTNQVFDVINNGFLSSYGTDGTITIDLSGLTPGETYRMQTFHLWDTGSEGSRDMVLSDGDYDSVAFSMYYDIDGSTITSAVTKAVTFYADSTNKTFFVKTAGADRAYLNALSLFKVFVDPYETWLSGYDVGSDSDMTDDPDGDALNNLYEWALGGNPSDSNDVGSIPIYEVVVNGESNFFQYVHARRSDADELGLTYYLEWTDDLVSTSWTNANYDIVGTNITGEAFDYVTNRISINAAFSQFLKLVVESN